MSVTSPFLLQAALHTLAAAVAAGQGPGSRDLARIIGDLQEQGLAGEGLVRQSPHATTTACSPQHAM